MAGPSDDEFPLLKAHGLIAFEIRGDGNCLFNALSDQIYGHQNDHHKIRARVIEYMREHASYYKQFIDVQPGGGQRRNPKRKNAGVYSTPTTFTPPTQEEIDSVFESHLGSMARGGTYGDNMEISAFASAFGIDVKIYQHDFAYMISAPDDGTEKQVAHIAYHTWEHYSSIRNINGPFTGLPEVNAKALSPEEDAKNKAAAAKVSHVAPWMVNVVVSSLPYLADRETIRKTLEECKGNIDTAVSLLMDAEDRASVSSQSQPSTERDPDSDDEEFYGPNKKQDRRMSRATKNIKKEKAAREQREQREALLKSNALAKDEPTAVTESTSQPVDLSAQPYTGRVPNLITRKTKKEEEDEWASDDDKDGNFHPDVEDLDDDAASEYSGTSRSQSTAPESIVPKPQIKLTFNNNKTYQKPVGPQRRNGTARERIELKKAAQKAARKERKQAASKSTGQLEVTSVNLKTNSPPLELGMGIKTLYI